MVQLLLWSNCSCCPAAPVLQLLYGLPAMVVQAPRLARSDLCQSPEFIYILIHACFKKMVPLSLSQCFPHSSVSLFVTFLVLPCIITWFNFHPSCCSKPGVFILHVLTIYSRHNSNIFIIVFSGKAECNILLLLFPNNHNNIKYMSVFYINVLLLYIWTNV